MTNGINNFTLANLQYIQLHVKMFQEYGMAASNELHIKHKLQHSSMTVSKSQAD